MSDKLEMLRHFLAALAYRTQKALREADDSFANFDPGRQVRTPRELVLHMTSVLGYARTFIIGGSYRPEQLPTFDDEIECFHKILADLSTHFANGDTFINGMTEEKMLQGPLSDAMTHAGQLAMLRRLAGQPVRPENFIYAQIDRENLTSSQPDPAAPDEVWKEAPR